MKQNRWIALGIFGCLLLAALAYFWATAIMDSLYAFRSPLKDNPPAPGPALGTPLTRRVVFILIDALRDDTSRNKDVMPFLNLLREQGASSTTHSRTPSYSAPGYSVLMTGAWPDISDGPAMNPAGEEPPRTWTQDNLFTAAHRSGLKTAVSGYVWFRGLIPQADVDASFYTKGEDKSADRQVVDAAIPWLKSGDYRFTLIHIDQVDYAGHHEGGPQSPNWGAAAGRADELVREIASYLDLKQDTLMVVSDHGQIDRGGHGGQDPIVLLEPLVIAGAGVKPGQYPDGQMVDVATTAAALLGLSIPADSQGLVRTDMLDVSAEQKATIDRALTEQKQRLLANYQAAIHSKADYGLTTNTAGGALQAMDNARDKRLNSERLPRFVLAILLALIPAAVLVWKRGAGTTRLLGSALVYLALFNFIYAVLAGRTYSLSSVASPTDIILFTAMTAALSLLTAWLVASRAQGWFKASPHAEAERTLGLTFTILYLLSLPILWNFALNGALITWTLPDMASMFMGFLSILQVLIVAVIGLLLTGIAALLASSSKPRKSTS